MKKNTTFMFAAAVAALLLAGCDKEQQGYDSFILDIAGFSGADGSKAYWDNSGFWWENTETAGVGDAVRINGAVHNIYRDGSQWKTHAENGEPTYPANDGNYYIAYAGTKTTLEDFVWDSDSMRYGPVEFDGTIVPLARSGSGNRMTLAPCCAVIKGASSVTFYKDDAYTPGTVDGDVYSKAFIKPASSTLVNGTAMNMESGYNTLTDVDRDGYIIIPVAGNSVTAYLDIDGSYTTSAVTLKKGYLYTIDTIGE